LNPPTAYLPTQLFTGTQWLTNHAILVQEGRIADMVPETAVSGNYERKTLPGMLLAPAFIDLQIYGAYESLFAVNPGTEALQKLEAYCNAGGAAFCLPTIATNTTEVMLKGIDAIRAYWKAGGTGILGLHLEGPWINKEKRGAHIEALIKVPQPEEVKELLEYGKGVIKMITLAPECCPKAIIELIRSYGIVISAGHSNATYEQAMGSFHNGIGAVTHLYNAMSPLQHRAPGLVGAAMDDAAVMVSIIPDGHHVDFAAVRIAKAAIKERLFAITDAVTATTEGYYPHEKTGDKYTSDGILSGSALDMAKALRNLVNEVKIDVDEALRMCSTYPAKVIGLQNELGKIEKGFNACFVLLNERLEVEGVIKEGVLFNI